MQLRHWLWNAMRSRMSSTSRRGSVPLWLIASDTAPNALAISGRWAMIPPTPSCTRMAWSRSAGSTPRSTGWMRAMSLPSGGTPPGVEEGDLLDRSTVGGLEVVAGEVRDRQEARLHEPLGDPQQRVGLVPPQQMAGGDHRPEPAAAQCELEAPDRGVDRRSPARRTALLLHARHDEHRDLVQMVHQVPHGGHDALLLWHWHRPGRTVVLRIQVGE